MIENQKETPQEKPKSTPIVVVFCNLGFRYSKVFFLLSLPSSRILEEGEALFSCHQN